MSLSTRSRKVLKNGLGSNSAGNEIADMMGGIKQKSTLECMAAVTTEIREITALEAPAVTGSVKEITQVICVNDTSKKERSQIIAVADASVKEQTQIVAPAHLGNLKEITQLVCPAETSVKEITQFVCPAELSVAEITQLVCVAETSVKEITQIITVAETGAKEITAITARADVGDDTNGKYFVLYDDVGSVAIWMENGAGAEPAHGCDRSIKVDTIATNDLIGTVGTKIYTKIIADSKFEAGSDDTAGNITVQCSIGGVRIDGSAGTSGMTVLQSVAGVNSNLNGKYFVLQDEVGSVAVWFDVDARGTTEPVHGCDRAIKVDTIVSADVIGTVGTAIYSKIIADSKFNASNDDLGGTIQVEASLSGVRAPATDGDSPFTTSSHQTGIVSNYDGTFVKMYDNAGSVAVWFDVDARGTAAPVHGCDRAIKVDTITNGMAIGAVGTAIYAIVSVDPGFGTHNDDLGGTIQIACALSGARTAATAETSPITPSVHQLGVASNYDGTFVKMYDEVGSVAFWFDLDNRGTAAPVHGCDRAVEISTLTNGMTAGQVGTAIYTAIDGDGKFVGNSDNTFGTIKIEASLSGVRTISSQETSPLGTSRDTLGVASNYDGLFLKMYDEVGSVAVWFDVDNRGTLEPTHGCDRAIEVSTVNNAMTPAQAGTAIYNKLDADAKFNGKVDGGAGTITIESSTNGVKTDSTAETSPITISTTVQGRTDNYHELFFILYDEVGSVGCWVDVDDAGGAAPAGALLCARQLEIETVTSAMTAGQVGTAIYNKIDGDGKFVGISDDTNGTIVVESSTYGAKTDATAETSPLTISVAQQGVDSNLNGTYFIIHDEVGSIGCWFDIDDAGTIEPAHGCDRGLEINTVTSAMTIGQVGTAIYGILDGDAKILGISDNTTGTIVVESTTYGAKTNITAETSPLTVSVAQQGVDSNYNQKFFKIYDEVGSVGVWFDVDAAGGAAPADALLCDRQLKVDTITSEMLAADIGTAIYTVMEADSKFEPGADGLAGTFTIQSTTAGVKADATAETSPCTVSVTQQGADNYNGKYFVMYDIAGSVGIWFDVDNLGTTIPTGASDCDRAIEVTTLTSGMTNIQAMTAIYNKITADSKFEAGADAGDGTCTIRNTEYNSVTDASAGTSALTVSTSVQGITSNYDGVYLILGDSAGSIGLWFDVDNRGTTIPAGAAAADRAIEVTTLTSGMTAQQAMDAIITVLTTDAVLTVVDVGDASATIESDATGVSDQTPSDFADVIEVRTITAGKDDGGTLTTKTAEILRKAMCRGKTDAIYLNIKAAIEAGSATGTLSTNAKKVLNILLCDRTAYNEIVALY